MSAVITSPPTLRTIRSVAARALGRVPLDVSWDATPFARVVRVTLRGGSGDGRPVGMLLPRPHDHLWGVDDAPSLTRFEQQLHDLVRPVVAVPTGPRLRRADVCPWAPCGEPQRPVRFGGTEPDDSSLWAGDALVLDLDDLRAWAGMRRDDAARATGLRPDLTTILADAFGAGEFLTVPELLTLITLAPVDRLPLEAHVATCRRLTAWWNVEDVDLRAVLVVHGATVVLASEQEAIGLDDLEGTQVVELETSLRGVANHRQS